MRSPQILFAGVLASVALSAAAPAQARQDSPDAAQPSYIDAPIVQRRDFRIDDGGRRRPPFDAPIQAPVIDRETLRRVVVPSELLAVPGATAVAGVCTVVFDVAPDGRVIAGSVTADCNRARFVESAVATVAGWTYEPVMVDGEARAQTGVSATVRFRVAG